MSFFRSRAEAYTIFEFMLRIKTIKTLVLVQPKAYISAEKLQEVYRCALANRIGLIVIDCVCRKTTLPYEKKICILNDFSDIII